MQGVFRTLKQHSLVRMVAERAATTPQQAALVTMDESVTFAQLRDLAISFALHMRRHRIGRGARLALMPEHPIVATGLGLACALVGCSWVAAIPSVLTHPGLGLTHVLHLGPPPVQARVPCLAVDGSWAQPPAGGGAASLSGYASDDDYWMIARSSGTTGEPKFIGLSERVMFTRAHAHGLPPGMTRPACLSLFPLLAYTGTGLLLRTLALGGTFVFADLQDIFGRTRLDVVLGSPMHFQAFMNNVPPGATRIPLARLAGGVVGPAMLRRMFTYFDRVMNDYGSTEAATTATNILDPGDIGDTPPSAGHAMAGVTVQIVGDNGVALPPDVEGTVRVRSPAQARGYLGNAALSATVFRDGWFYPGDMGTLSADGELRITGRTNDQLNVGGSKMNPAPVDTVVQETAGVRDGACFALTDETGLTRIALAVCLAAPVDVTLLAQTLRDAIATRVAPSRVPFALFVLDRIPRNANGKIARTELPAAVSGVPPVPVPSP